MKQTLHFEIINGHELWIQQELLDISMGQGPFIPGLKSAILDGIAIGPEALRAFLITVGRGDLIVKFKIPTEERTP
jgi:hypothetical protein